MQCIFEAVKTILELYLVCDTYIWIVEKNFFTLLARIEAIFRGKTWETNFWITNAAEEEAGRDIIVPILLSN